MRFFFFRNYANYALRTELCDFALAHNSGSPSNCQIVCSHLICVYPLNDNENEPMKVQEFLQVS